MKHPNFILSISIVSLCSAVMGVLIFFCGMKAIKAVQQKCPCADSVYSKPCDTTKVITVFPDHSEIPHHF